MEEDMKNQIEQLRVNRAKSKPKSSVNMDNTLSNEKDITSKKDDGIFGVLLFQCIIAVILAIIFIVLMTFSRPIGIEIKWTISNKIQNDFSFKDKVYDKVGGFITYLNTMQPIVLDENASADKKAESQDEINFEEDTFVNNSEIPNESIPVPQSSEVDIGAGGELNPVLQNEIPANATFAPMLFTGSITFPINSDYKISSSFGFRNNPSNGVPEFHTALDIAADKGTPIKAAASGVIVSSKNSGSLGKHIIIDHSNGFLTIYGHCDKLIAKEGAHIREGEIIAKVGSTGASTGNHLHFAMKKDGLYFDPACVFEKEAKLDDEI